MKKGSGPGAKTYSSMSRIRAKFIRLPTFCPAVRDYALYWDGSSHWVVKNETTASRSAMNPLTL